MSAHCNNVLGPDVDSVVGCALFDGGSVEDYLKKVHDFLTANPNEVLTLIFTNPEGASLKDLWDPPFQASGIADLAFVPPHLPMKQSEVMISIALSIPAEPPLTLIHYSGRHWAS